MKAMVMPTTRALLGAVAASILACNCRSEDCPDRGGGGGPQIPGAAETATGGTVAAGGAAGGTAIAGVYAGGGGAAGMATGGSNVGGAGAGGIAAGGSDVGGAGAGGIAAGGSDASGAGAAGAAGAAGVAGGTGECPRVYSDAGIPPDSVLWTWDGSEWGLPGGEFDGGWTDCGDVPEGSSCFRTWSGAGNNYAGWGVFYPDGARDFSSCDRLVFWVMTEDVPTELKVELQQGSENGPKSSSFIDGFTPGVWQEISLSPDDFPNVDPSQLYGVFLITAEAGDATFYVDDVRWE